MSDEKKSGDVLDELQNAREALEDTAKDKQDLPGEEGDESKESVELLHGYTVGINKEDSQFFFQTHGETDLTQLISLHKGVDRLIETEVEAIQPSLPFAVITRNNRLLENIAALMAPLGGTVETLRNKVERLEKELLTSSEANDDTEENASDSAEERAN